MLERQSDTCDGVEFSQNDEQESDAQEPGHGAAKPIGSALLIASGQIPIFMY